MQIQKQAFENNNPRVGEAVNHSKYLWLIGILFAALSVVADPSFDFFGNDSGLKLMKQFCFLLMAHFSALGAVKPFYFVELRKELGDN